VKAHGPEPEAIAEPKEPACEDTGVQRPPPAGPEGEDRRLRGEPHPENLSPLDSSGPKPQEPLPRRRADEVPLLGEGDDPEDRAAAASRPTSLQRSPHSSSRCRPCVAAIATSAAKSGPSSALSVTATIRWTSVGHGAHPPGRARCGGELRRVRLDPFPRRAWPKTKESATCTLRTVAYPSERALPRQRRVGRVERVETPHAHLPEPRRPSALVQRQPTRTPASSLVVFALSPSRARATHASQVSVTVRPASAGSFGRTSRPKAEGTRIASAPRGPSGSTGGAPR